MTHLRPLPSEQLVLWTPPPSPHYNHPHHAGPSPAQELSYRMLWGVEMPKPNVPYPTAAHLRPSENSTNTVGISIRNYYSTRTLLHKLLVRGKSVWKPFNPNDKREEAQSIVDFLSRVLDDEDGVEVHEAKQILSVIRMIAKLSEIFPSGCELVGVDCDFGDRVSGGGFADIFRGMYKGQAVCVKAARIANTNRKNERAQAKEFMLWAHLSHPNILPFYGVYIPRHFNSPRICIVSQWMGNGDLRSYVLRYPNSPKMLLLSDVISGLQYLHENEIIHADLKAANVLVTETGHAVIGDFGISRVVSGLSTTNPDSKGTNNWTAPELTLVENSIPSERSDIWSFGCLCYEVMVDEEPFYWCQNFGQVFNALLKKKTPFDGPNPPARQHQIDAWIRALMEQCWDFDEFCRPSAKGIHDRFQILNIPDRRPPQKRDDAVLREVQEARSYVKINYSHVRGVFERLLSAQEETPKPQMSIF
ncbi:Cytokinesis protein sepH [Leucoagaricus sp. SymC.cos]|nr:Cytokinesis protein sepH [Leucoagaricus sp. SymC.cos]